MSKNKKDSKVCMHDYKNAIQVGNVDYMCPLCKNLLNPMEWFFMNSFNFVDVELCSGNKKVSKRDKNTNRDVKKGINE